MTIRAGSKIIANDFALPDVVTAYGNGTNTVTATSFADLPDAPCSAEITNPHPSADLIVLVTYGAWLKSNGTVFLRMCPAVSGSTSIAAGIGSGGPAGWGEIPGTEVANNVPGFGSSTYALPASATAATFDLQAYRDSASGTQTCNYPVLRLIPIRFDV